VEVRRQVNHLDRAVAIANPGLMGGVIDLNPIRPGVGVAPGKADESADTPDEGVVFGIDDVHPALDRSARK
jgi:hypothetical protein